MTVWAGGAWPAALARAQAGTDVAEALVVGDSITLGSRASDMRRRSMWARTATALRDLYGDGGDGFCPWPWGTVTGTVSSNFATGPNGHVVILDSTDRWSLDGLSGTRVDVLLRRAAGDGTARWRIDGGAWQTQSCTGTTGWIRASADGLGEGPHVVDVEAQTGTVAVFGAEARHPIGARLHTMGLGLRRAGDVDDTAWLTPSVTEYSPHLVAVALGVNDSNLGGTSAAAFTASIDAIVTAARAARADCDLVLVANHLGAFDDNDYDDMVAGLRTVVDDHGGLLIDLDLWARTLPDGTTTDRHDTDPTGTSWGRWATWGWWGDLTTPGPSGADPVHPGDTGHLVLAQVLTEVLTTPETPPVTDSVEIEDGGLLT